MARALWNIMRRPIKTLRYLSAGYFEIKANQYYAAAKSSEWMPENTFGHAKAELDKSMGDLFITISETIRGSNAEE